MGLSLGNGIVFAWSQSAPRATPGRLSETTAPWTVACLDASPADDKTTRICQMARVLQQTKTRQRVMTVNLVTPGGDGSVRGAVMAPRSIPGRAVTASRPSGRRRGARSAGPSGGGLSAPNALGRRGRRPAKVVVSTGEYRRCGSHTGIRRRSRQAKP